MDPNMEKDYSDEVLSKMYTQVQRLKRFSVSIGMVAFACISLHGLLTVPWTTGSEAFKASGGATWLSVYGHFCAYHIALHMIPKSMSECLCCGLTFLFQMMILLCNPFRLRRFNVEMEIIGGINTRWLQSCEPDLVESARDSLRAAMVLCNDVCFNACVPVRSKVSLIKLVMSIACCSVIFHPFLRPDDGANYLCNYINLVVGLCLNWYFSYDHERKHREIWRLEKKSKEQEKAREQAERLREAEASSLLELLNLICPVVVFVYDGQITQSASFVEYFGVNVSTLFDLPTVQEKGSPNVDLGSIVRESQTGKVPTKRGVTIRPLGGMTAFRCTVCAVFAESRKGVYLGFQVEEQWAIVSTDPSSSEEDRVVPQENVEISRAIELGNSVLDETAAVSVNENLYSSLEEYGSSFARLCQKRVSFEKQTDSECSSTHGVTPQARRKFFDLNKCQIDPAALRIHDDTNIAGAFRETRPVRAFLHSAPVHLHPRAQELAQHEATKVIVHEVKTLLRCLHPNVLCLFGFVYDLHGGAALVMEPAWDSVAAALHSMRPIANKWPPVLDMTGVEGCECIRT